MQRDLLHFTQSAAQLNAFDLQIVDLAKMGDLVRTGKFVWMNIGFVLAIRNLLHFQTVHARPLQALRFGSASTAVPPSASRATSHTFVLLWKAGLHNRNCALTGLVLLLAQCHRRIMTGIEGHLCHYLRWQWLLATEKTEPECVQ